MEFEGGHRMRELKAWSKIKKELDDGSFNNKNVEAHQLETYQKVYKNKAAAITQATPQGDVFNIYSQLQTDIKEHDLPIDLDKILINEIIEHIYLDVVTNTKLYN